MLHQINLSNKDGSAMKKIVLIFFALAVFAPISINAQSTAVRKGIRNMSCPEAEIKAVKLGPSKSGYLASCPASGANRSESIFEKSRSLYDGGIITFQKTTHLGYYDFTDYSYSPSGGSIETKKWNGSKYVRSKCQEFDINNNGKTGNYRPCSF